MGAIPSMLGIGNSGAGGSGLNYQAGTTGIQQPATTEQANQAYQQTQEALKQQQNFVNALQSQGGVQNQSDVFSQLKGIANGTGPNPAQAMLSNATGANVANQAALMAGQRGSGANVGLMGRQAAMQGGNIQQQAAGQGALMQAQQSLGALGQMGGIAGQQVGELGSATMGYNEAAQGSQRNLLNAIGQQNNANVGMQGSINSANSGLAQVAAKGQQGFLGGALQGGAMALMAAKGGEIPGYDEGGSVAPSPTLGLPTPPPPIAAPAVPLDPRKPQSFIGKFSKGAMGNQNPDAMAPSSQSDDTGSYKAGEAVGQGFGALGKALFSKKPTDTNMNSIDNSNLDGPPPESRAKGGDVGHKLRAGGHVPGQAKVKGDSYANDIVSAKLSPGEIVIPRSIAQGKDAAKKSAAFVAAILAKQGRK